MDFPACSCKSQAVCVHVQKVPTAMCSVCLRKSDLVCLLCLLLWNVVDTVDALPWFFEAIRCLLQLRYFLWIGVLATWNLCHLRNLARCILGIAVSCSYYCGLATAGLGLGQEYSIRDWTVELISHIALPWREFKHETIWKHTLTSMRDWMKHRYSET